MTEEPFALVLNCVDGRVQRPLLSWIREELSLEKADYLTLPGPDGAFAEGGAELERARRLAGFLSEHRRHTCLVVAGHHDCLGNPVADEAHRRQIEAAARTAHGWGLTPRTIGAWIGEGWTVEIIADRRDGRSGG